MNNFKDFNLKPTISHFTGDKIPVKKILNVPITVLEYKVEPSKKKEGTELLTLQIEKAGEKRVVFTGSAVLIDLIKRVPKEGFPFGTTIIHDNDYYEFT